MEINNSSFQLALHWCWITVKSSLYCLCKLHHKSPRGQGLCLSFPSLSRQVRQNTCEVHNRCSINTSWTSKMRNKCVCIQKWFFIHKIILALHKTKCRHDHCLLKRNFGGKNHHLRFIHSSNILDQFSHILVSEHLYNLKNCQEPPRGFALIGSTHQGLPY